MSPGIGCRRGTGVAWDRVAGDRLSPGNGCRRGLGIAGGRAILWDKNNINNNHHTHRYHSMFIWYLLGFLVQISIIMTKKGAVSCQELLQNFTNNRPTWPIHWWSFTCPMLPRACARVRTCARGARRAPRASRTAQHRAGAAIRSGVAVTWMPRVPDTVKPHWENCPCRRQGVWCFLLGQSYSY